MVRTNCRVTSPLFIYIIAEMRSSTLYKAQTKTQFLAHLAGFLRKTVKITETDDQA